MKRELRALAPLWQWGRVSGRLARRGFWPLALLLLALLALNIGRGSFWAGLGAAGLAWPVLAAAIRRLHDTGRSGLWLIALFVPPFSLVVLAFLILPPLQRSTIHDSHNDAPAGPIALGAFAIALIAFGSFATIGTISRANMKPALLPGDLVLIWRRGAGGRGRASCWPSLCPFDWSGAPEPGSVVALRGPKGDLRAARVIAGPGQQVALRGGRIVLDGAEIPQRPLGLYREPFGPQGPARLLPRCRNGAVGLGARCQKPALSEAGRTILDTGPSALDEMPARIVPEGMVFVLSDNRDLGEDSRVSPIAGGLGMVPQSDMIGRIGRVLVSARGPGIWDLSSWRGARILKGIE